MGSLGYKYNKSEHLKGGWGKFSQGILHPPTRYKKFYFVIQGIMKLLEKNNLFKGYSDLLLLGVYTDKIIAEIARKEKDGVKIIASAEEPVEDDGISAEKIRLNCEKAIQRLPAEQVSGVKNMACVLGGGVSILSFAVDGAVRKDADTKISVQELSALAGEDRAGSVVIEKRFLVDGFAVEDPVGITGKEISASVLRFSLDENIEKALALVSAEYGMSFEGVLDSRLVFLRRDSAGPENRCVIFIFSEKTTIYVTRSGAAAAVSDIEAGYGIMIKKTASAFGVGFEEGKDLLNKFRNNQIDQSASEAIKTVLEEAAADITDKIRAALFVIDRDNLIPGNVFVIIAENFPELEKTLAGTQWLDGLPIDRNMSIKIESFNLLKLL